MSNAITWPLKADPSGFKSGLSEASGAAKAFGSVLQGIGQGVGQKLFDGILAGAKALPAALIGATQATVQLGSRLTELRDKTGVSIEGLQKLGFAAKMSGGDMEAVAKGVNVFQKNLATGSQASAQALSALGLASSDLRKALPEDAFVKVAEAIRNVKNPTDQAALAMQLFGKSGAEMLPMIKAGLADAAAEAERLGLVMSSKTANAADALGDAVDTLQMTFSGLGRNVASVVVENESLHVAIKGVTQIFAGLSKIVHDNKDVLSDWVTTGVGMAIRGLQMLVEGAVVVRQSWNEMNRGVRSAMIFGLEHFSLGGADTDTMIDSLRQQQRESDAATASTTNFLTDLNSKFYELNNAAEAARGQTAGFTDDTKNLGGALLDLSTKAEKAKKSLGTSTGAGSAFFLSGVSLEDDVFSDNNARIVPTVTAGDVGGEWSGELDEVQDKLKLNWGTTEDWSRALRDVAAGFELIGGSSNAVTRTIGLATTALSGAMQASAAYATGDVAGMVSGGVNTASSLYQMGAQGGTMGTIASAVSPIALVGNLFGGGEKGQVEDMRSRMLDAQGGLQALGEKAAEVGLTLDAVFAAENVEEYTAALAELDAAMDPLAEAQAKLAEAVERYGFTVAELGPVMQEQALHEQFETLFTDWQLLTASGIDHETVIRRMGPAMNEYVASVMASGAAIPEAMRPALQSMVDMGLLTDDAGNAMTSLEGIDFAKTLTQNVQDLVSSVGRLVDALNGVPNIERTLTVKKIIEDDGGSLPSYARGGHIDYDQVALLHAGETVVPDDMAETWAQAVTGGAGSDALAAEMRDVGRRIDSLVDLLPRAVRDALAGNRS